MYKLKKGEHYKGLTADVIGKALEEIRVQNDGQLITEKVVEEASNNNHPLHEVFTWDDSIAGHLYRLDEARKLIRIVIVTKNNSEVPAFVNVIVNTDDDESEQYYQSVNVLTKTEYDSALEQANRRLKESVRSLEQLKAVAPSKNKRGIQQAIGLVEKAQKRI